MLTISVCIGSSVYSTALSSMYQPSHGHSLHHHNSSSHLSTYSSHSNHHPSSGYGHNTYHNQQHHHHHPHDSFASSTANSVGLPPLNTTTTNESSTFGFVSNGNRTPSISAAESRRSSVSIDSRMNQGISSLNINGNPIPTTNVSQASLPLGNGFESSNMNQLPSPSVSTPGLLSHRSSNASNTSFHPPPSAASYSHQHHSPSSSSPMLHSHSASHHANTSERHSHSSYVVPRIAPTIAENPEADIYNAENPTRGKAYAFPDPLLGNLSGGSARSSLHSSSGIGTGPVRRFSRRMSNASFGSGNGSIGRKSGEIASSDITVNEKMPSAKRDRKAVSIYGEGRLPEGQLELPLNHHHPMQHKQVRSLIGDPASPNLNGAAPTLPIPNVSITPSAPPSAGNSAASTTGTTRSGASASPYSRTPELRVSHKLAERKRRSEMKDCFEALRARLPSGISGHSNGSPNGASGAAASGSNKSSKWETLQRSIEYIDHLEKSLAASREREKEREKLLMQQHRQDMDNARGQMESVVRGLQSEIEELKARVSNAEALSASAAHAHQGTPLTPHSGVGLSGHGHGHSALPNSGFGRAEPGRTLPPLIGGMVTHSTSGGPGRVSSPTPMQGVQYD